MKMNPLPKEKKYTFPKEEKLCNFHRIRMLFENGKSLKKFPLKLLYLEEKSSTSTQVLISIPKRKIRKATQRNRLKRLVRESYRTLKADFPLGEKSYSLAFIYMGNELMSYHQMRELVAYLLKELANIAEISS